MIYDPIEEQDYLNDINNMGMYVSTLIIHDHFFCFLIKTCSKSGTINDYYLTMQDSGSTISCKDLTKSTKNVFLTNFKKRNHKI